MNLISLQIFETASTLFLCAGYRRLSISSPIMLKLLTVEEVNFSARVDQITPDGVSLR